MDLVVITWKIAALFRGLQNWSFIIWCTLISYSGYDYHHFTLLRIFHTCISWSFPTEVRVTASLLKSPGLFSVWRPILIIPSFGCSPLVLFYPYPPVSLSILWLLYQAHQLQLVSPSFSCSIVFFQISCKVKLLIILSTFFQFYPVIRWNDEIHYSVGHFFFFFFWSMTSSRCLAEIRWFISFSRTNSGLYIYRLFVWSNLHFFHNSK